MPVLHVWALASSTSVLVDPGTVLCLDVFPAVNADFLTSAGRCVEVAVCAVLTEGSVLVDSSDEKGHGLLHVRRQVLNFSPAQIFTQHL